MLGSLLLISLLFLLLFSIFLLSFILGSFIFFTFNLLDARHAVSVTERQRYILCVRQLAIAVANAYYQAREALGFPMKVCDVE